MSLDSLCGILHKIQCMRNFIKHIVFTGCMLLLLSSCSERHKLRRTMSKFVQTEIQIPGDLECVYNREVTIINKDTLKPYKLIVYYDSLDCSSCRISHLMDLYPLYDMADTSNFSVITIFSPKKENLEEVSFQIQILDPTIPVYIDRLGSFAQFNQGIPLDVKFHSFLVNNDDIVVLVGNPLYNENIAGLLNKIINNNSND